MPPNQPDETAGPRIVRETPPEKPSPDDALVEAVASALPDDDEAAVPVEPAKSGGTEDIPTILLVQAGLTVFNGAIILIYLAMWMIDLTLLGNILRVGAGFAILLALAPMGLGVYIERKNRKQNTKPPGIIWAHAGVYTGAVMCTLTLIIPMIVTMRSLMGAGPTP
jgi:hypothetical protein